MIIFRLMRWIFSPRYRAYKRAEAGWHWLFRVSKHVILNPRIDRADIEAGRIINESMKKCNAQMRLNQ